MVSTFSIPEDRPLDEGSLENIREEGNNESLQTSSWFSMWSSQASGSLFSSRQALESSTESMTSSDYRSPEVEPVILEAAMDLRKGNRGLWKRHYVVVNFAEEGSITCHRAPVLKKNPTRVDPVALFIPSFIEWTCLDIDNTPNMFVIQILTSEHQNDSRSLSLEDSDEISVVSESTDGQGKVQNTYYKDYAKAERVNKPLRYFLRFHHDKKTKAFWLKNMRLFNRLSDQSERKRTVLRFVPAVSSTRTGGTGSIVAHSPERSSVQWVPLSARRGSIVPLAAHEQAELLAQKRGATAADRFLINPDYAYPNTRMDRDELRVEMNKPSKYYHDLRVPSRRGEEIGLLRVEVLQCLGLPKLDAIGETDGYCLAVCGSYAFKTDVIPRVANPMWLSRMRRACIFPLFEAYARLYVGVFDDDGPEERDDFAGRIVLDIARLRPRCTYDVTLPLRLSGDVYMRRPRGAIRMRFHVSWKTERAAMLSYLPKSVPKFAPHDSVTVACADKKSFQNVALTVHGTHMQGRFSMKKVKSLVREINFTRIHVLRYMRKRELRNLRTWQNPYISGFIFISWMHSVYYATVQYVPGHIITFFLMYLWKNYAKYGMDGPLNNGFTPPTWEEMFAAVLWGTSSEKHYIEPIELGMESERANPMQLMGASTSNVGQSTDIDEIASKFRRGVKVTKHRFRLKTYNHTFVGSGAVDFLVNKGYANSRAEAVEIGRQLERKKLFEHVARKHEFKDERLFYYFLVKDSSTRAIATSGGKAQGRSLFRFLGFLNEEENYDDDQLEMPYSEGSQCPRFTVKESLVIRSKESKRLLKRVVSYNDDDEDAAELGVEAPTDKIGNEAKSAISKLDSFLGPSSAAQPLEQEDVDPEDEDTIVTVKILKKPPNQDIDFKSKGSDKPITDVLAEARHKVHGVLLHAFNDKLYSVKDTAPDATKPSAMKKSKLSRFKHSVGKTISSPIRSNRKKTGGSVGTGESSLSVASSTESSGRKKSKKKQKGSIESEKDEIDKVLSVGKSSSSNPWVNKVGVILTPIIEIAYEWLCLFRALFNLFTWRDPILSFWVSIIAPIVALVLHFFPWRIVMGVVGLAVFGPQNWAFRIMRERRGIEEPDMDKLIRKKKRKTKGEEEEEDLDEPFFCNDTVRNEPLDYEQLARSHQARHIAVPYSPLMYSHRFYDWPPEPDYARVKPDTTGANDEDLPTAEASIVDLKDARSRGTRGLVNRRNRQKS